MILVRAAVSLACALAGSACGGDPVAGQAADASAAVEDGLTATDAGDIGDTGDSKVAVDAADAAPPGDATMEAGIADAVDDAETTLDSWTGSWACPSGPEPACGGPLEGTTWTVVDFCPEDPTAAAALFQHPYGNLAACKPPGGTVKGQLVDTGEISFVDGQAVMNIGGYAETLYTFTPECLQAAKPGLAPAEACTGMAKPDLMTCSYGVDAKGVDGCTCLAKVPKEGGKQQLPYAIVGGKTLKIGTEMSAAYCIQGDRLLLDVSPHIISWRWWLFKRKL